MFEDLNALHHVKKELVKDAAFDEVLLILHRTLVCKWTVKESQLVIHNRV